MTWTRLSAPTGPEPQLTLVQGIYRYPDGSSYMWQKYSGSPDRVLELAESAVQRYMSTPLPGGISGVVESNAQPHPSRSAETE